MRILQPFYRFVRFFLCTKVERAELRAQDEIFNISRMNISREEKVLALRHIGDYAKAIRQIELGD